jgi:uncharacterized protein
MTNRRSFLKETALPLLAAKSSTSSRWASASNTPWEIWDVHCHLQGFEGQTPEDKMAEMIRLADRMGIARMCVFMGYPFEIDPSPEKLREQNNQVLRAIRRWPNRAFGFVYLNPRHIQASLDELNRCIRDGPMVGVKLWVAQRDTSLELDPIIERAAALHAVIFQHTWFKTGGNLPGESTPADLVELAHRHPTIPMICGHTGGNWELGIRTIRGVKNLYSDLAGSDPTSGFVEMAVRELGPERVLYGSDVGGRSFASQLGKVLGANISDPVRSEIFSKNLHRLMLPILTAKGIKL